MPEYNVRNPRQGDFDADINALKAADSQLLARIAAMERANAQPSPAVTNTNNYVQASSSSGLTSVSLAMPSQFTLDNSPLTTNGVITVSLASQASNLLWASPDGASGIPTFRSLALADIPNLLVTGAKIANTTVTVGKLSATGTADSTTFLRGDGAWATPARDFPINGVTALSGGSGSSYTYTLSTSNKCYDISSSAVVTIVTLPAMLVGEVVMVTKVSSGTYQFGASSGQTLTPSTISITAASATLTFVCVNTNDVRHMATI